MSLNGHNCQRLGLGSTDGRVRRLKEGDGAGSTDGQVLGRTDGVGVVSRAGNYGTEGSENKPNSMQKLRETTNRFNEHDFVLRWKL